MKCPKLYIDRDSLIIQLSQNHFIVLHKDKTLYTEKRLCTSSNVFLTNKEVAIKKFGKQLKELRLLPLVEQEPTFDYPVYSYDISKMCYYCTINESSYFYISPKRQSIDCYYEKDLHMPTEKEIITKQEFFAACGDFIEKANLKEVFTILND